MNNYGQGAQQQNNMQLDPILVGWLINAQQKFPAMKTRVFTSKDGQQIGVEISMVVWHHRSYYEKVLQTAGQPQQPQQNYRQ